MASKQHNPAVDIIAAAGLIVLSLVFLVATLDLRESPYEPLGPAAVPKAISLLILVCAMVLMGRGIYKFIRNGGFADLRLGPNAGVEVSGPKYQLRPKLAIMVMILLVIYIGLLHWQLLGYRTGCTLFMLATGLLTLWYEKRTIKPFHVAILLVLTLLMAFGGYYVFTQILVIDLP
jgi:hypothetical protein